VCKNDPIYNIYKDIRELPPHISNEIRHFFRVYKQLENKKTIVNNMKGAKHAREVIAKSLKAYVDKFVEYEPFAY
jgi:inorganic pyrophosphatase